MKSLPCPICGLSNGFHNGGAGSPAELAHKEARANVSRDLLKPYGWQRMRCPTCSSPNPRLHPALQHEGEVNPCSDTFHKHEVGCDYPRTKPCRLFSTDGTLLGAAIAHQMGTDDEDEIKEMGRKDLDQSRHLTGMDEEQTEWEGE